MNPAFSVVVFTAAAGAAQGLVVAIAAAVLAEMPLAPASLRAGLGVALVLLVAGLAASFLHLGRPERAWRAAAMWRTSWLSREVIVLPAFTAWAAAWWWTLGGARPSPPSALVPLGAVALAALLWYCTAMIYACLRFIEEWAQPLTVVNFVLIGMSSGLVLAAATAALAGEDAASRTAAIAAAVGTLAAWAARAAAMRRNAVLRHRSTLQSATGIQAARLVQTSMGMSAGSFNTREFFHRASRPAMRRVKLIAGVLAFAAPALVVALVGAGVLPPIACAIAAAVQAPGLIADRWLFFAQARHPQNLYYQLVS
jgi:DMSO reductase anchor subunit